MLLYELENAVKDAYDRFMYAEKSQVIVRIEGKDYRIRKCIAVVSKGDYGTLEILAEEMPGEIKQIDPYGKEAIKDILITRDKISEEEAQETIAGFEEELKELAESKDDFSTIEELFEATFGLEPDYLFCFLNELA